MKIEHEDLGGLKHRLSITVDRDALDKERRKLARRYATQVRIPGFRPGHAPLDLVLKSLGPKLEYEIRENLISDTFASAVDQYELKPSTEPKFDLVGDSEDELSFTAEIEVFPVVDIKDYMGVEITAPSVPEVTEDAIDERIESMLKSLSRYEDKADDSVVEPDDMAEATVVIRDIATGQELKGEHTTRIVAGTDDEPLEGIGRVILGMKAGESKKLQARLGRIAARGMKLESEEGVQVDADVKVDKIRFRKRPELNGEFVKQHADVETVEEFRALLRKQLEEQRESRVKDETEELLLTRICDANPFEIGERTVERLAEMAEKEARDRVLAQIPEERRAELSKNFDLGVPREQSLIEARRNLTRSLVLEAIAEKEGVEVTEADIDDKIAETAAAYGMPVPRIRALLGEERIEQLGRQLRVSKTMDLLAKNAVLNPAADQAPAQEPAAEKPARKAKAKKAAAADAQEQPAADEAAPVAEEAAPAAVKKTAKKTAKKAEAPAEE